MRSILLTLFTIIACSRVHAQNDGKIAIGLSAGDIGYSSAAGFRFRIDPYISKYINDHWSVGVRGKFQGGPLIVSTVGNEFHVTNNLRTVVGLQGRYTLLPNRKFSPFVEAFAGISWNYQSRHLPRQISKNQTFRGAEANLGIGLDYRLSDRFSFLLRGDVFSYQSDAPFTLGNINEVDKLKFGLNNIGLGIEYRF